MILSQLYGAVGLAASATLWGSTPVPVKLTTFDHAMFLIVEGASADADGKITVQAGENQAMNNAEAIAFRYRAAAANSDQFGALTAAPSTGYDTGGGGNRRFIVEIDDSELPAGKPWVQLGLALNGGTDAPGAASAMVVPRYQGAAIETALA